MFKGFSGLFWAVAIIIVFISSFFSFRAGLPWQIGQIAIWVLVIIGIIRHVVVVRKELSAAAAEAKAAEETLRREQQQQELGQKLTKILQDAVAENNLYNVFQDGRVARSIRAFRVAAIPKNGTIGFSVCAGIVDDESMAVALPSGERGYPILQVDINLQKKDGELYAFYAPYGPCEDNVPLANFDNLAKRLSTYLREYRLFPA